jgi:hypothetical protein
MMDPVATISFVDPERSSGPTPESSLAPGIVHSFSSIAELDAALEAAGDSASFLTGLSLNDKIYRLRSYVADGTVTSASLLPAVTTDTSDPTDEVEPWGAVWVNTATPEVFQSDGQGNWTSIWSGA